MPRESESLEVMRRQILKALRPGIATTDELLAGVPLAGQDSAAVAEFRQALQELEGWGYIANLRGDQVREPWWKITGEGLAQIGQAAEKLDVRIWGRLAVR